MSASSLAELIARPSKDAVLDVFIAFLRMAGFPVASWDPFSLAREEFEAESEQLADLSATIQNVAKGGYNSTSEGPWLDLVSEEYYENERTPAVVTQGLFTLADPNGQGPLTKNPGEVWATDDSGTYRYKNIAGFTLPKNGSVAGVLFEAESAGAAFNLPNATVRDLVTSLPGITISNPDPGTGTWITQQGADVELDAPLQQRNVDKWSTLGTGGNDNAYEYWAKQADPQVRRARAIESNDGTGKVDLYLAGASGPVSPAVASAVDTYLRTAANGGYGMRPTGAVLTTHPANATTLAVVGDVLATPAAGRALADIKADVIEALNELAGGTDVGDVLYLSDIYTAIRLVTGVYATHISAPVYDSFVDLTSVFVLDVSGLTFALQ